MALLEREKALIGRESACAKSNKERETTVLHPLRIGRRKEENEVNCIVLRKCARNIRDLKGKEGEREDSVLRCKAVILSKGRMNMAITLWATET